MKLALVLGMRRSDVTMEDPRTGSRVLRAAVLLSVTAGLAHATVALDHLAEWWGYGVFFVVVAVAQTVYGALLATAPSYGLALAGVAGNATVLGLYVVTRTSGIPFGPHAGEVEHVGVADLVCGAAEAGLIVALVALAGRARLEAAPPRRRTAAVAAGWLVAALIGAPGASAVPAAADHEAAHAEPTSSAEPLPTLHHDPTPPPAPDPTEATAPAETNEPETPAGACRPVAAQPPGMPTAAAPGTARALVAGHGRDVWLHDLVAGTHHRLTRNPESCWVSHATFRDERTVSIGVENAVHDLDLVTGGLRAVLRDPAGIGAFAWSPDRRSIAYTTGLGVTVAAGTNRRQIVRFDDGGGRCGGEGDEVHVEWSPDGAQLLATVTWQDFSGETMWILSTADGRNVVKPRMGTYGRWSTDGTTVYYRDFDFSKNGGWHAVDVRTGAARSLAINRGALRLSASPDGKRLAYDDAAGTPSVYVYDLAKGTETKLAGGRALAVWLAPDRIAATGSRACKESDDCSHADWVETGSVAAFALNGSSEPIDGLTSTMNAEVLFAEAEPAAPSPSATASPSPSREPTPETQPTGVPTLPSATPEGSASPAPDGSSSPSPQATATATSSPAV